MLIFVTELVKLPFLLEQKFEKEVIQLSFKNHSDMYKNLSTSSKALVNVIIEKVYGESVEELRANAKELRANAKANAKAKAKVEKELKEIDQQRTTSIILLFTRLEMTIEEIAENLKINKDVVKQILLQNKVIK